VGPGVSTFHFLPDAPGVVAAVKSLFEQARNYTPGSVTWTIPNGGEVIDVATGQATSSWTQTGGGTVNGEGQNQYAAGVGGRIVWQTAGFNNGRRVRGSTFLVPMSANLYDIDGTFLPAVVIGMQSRIDTVLGSLDGDMVVWSHKAGTLTGSTSVITSGALADRTSWLRSRRT
jgi:hypothetical protein